MPFGLRTPEAKETRIRWGSRSPMVRGNFEGEGHPIVKYRDTLWLSVQKWLNQARYLLGLDGPKESRVRWAQIPMGRGNFKREMGGPF